MNRKSRHLAAIIMLLAGVPAAAATANDARSACRTRLQSQFSASATNIVASPRGPNRWQVSGTASRNGEQGHFTCLVNGYDVSNIETSDWEKKKDNTAAIAVGAVALAAIIAAAASRKRNHENDRYENDDNWNSGGRYDDSYSPTGGVSCYRAQRACYNSYNHSYNSRWSQREFGY